MDFLLAHALRENLARVMVGQDLILDLLLTAVLAEGHVLIESVPGLGKTLLAKTLARSMGGAYKRIQFTPDLLPADVTGFNLFDQQQGKFRFQPGPVLCNVLLADEINRTIPRTQASLLESMEERQVTVDGQTYPLPRPFLVLATLNPIEQEGTFPLPEAQLDRFLLKLKLDYPSPTEEVDILARFQETSPLEALEAVAAPGEVAALQAACRRIHVAPAVRAYIVALVGATRTHPAVLHGASPRGSQGLMRAAQATAALAGRDHVLPDDVKAVALPALAHRLILREEEVLRGLTPANCLAEIISRVTPPFASPAPGEP